MFFSEHGGKKHACNVMYLKICGMRSLCERVLWLPNCVRQGRATSVNTRAHIQKHSFPHTPHQKRDCWRNGARDSGLTRVVLCVWCRCVFNSIEQMRPIFTQLRPIASVLLSHSTECLCVCAASSKQLTRAASLD